MPRTLEATTLSGMMAERDGNVLLLVAILEHEESATIFRIVNNPEDIEHDGETYAATGFELTPAEESEEGFRDAQIVFNNVSQWLTPSIRSLSGAITVHLKLLTATDLAATPPVFDTVEIDMLPMTLQGIEWDAFSARGTLSYEGVTEQTFPCHTFNPTDFPGMFS